MGYLKKPEGKGLFSGQQVIYVGKGDFSAHPYGVKSQKELWKIITNEWPEKGKEPKIEAARFGPNVALEKIQLPKRLN